MQRKQKSDRTRNTKKNTRIYKQNVKNNGNEIEKKNRFEFESFFRLLSMHTHSSELYSTDTLARESTVCFCFCFHFDLHQKSTVFDE